MMPLFALGGILSTPDTPLIAAWCLGIWAALESRWRWFGVAAGCAMLSKYTGALLPLCILIAEPRSLRKRELWEAIAIATLIFIPNLWWNHAHDWASFRFQLSHIGEASGENERLAFFLGQMVLAGPLTILVGTLWLFSSHKTRRSRILAVSFALPWVIGIIVGGEANWAAPAYVSLAFAFSEMKGKWEKAAWSALSLNIVISGFLLAHAWSPIVDIKEDPVHRTKGGDVLAGAVTGWTDTPLLTERYQEASWIQFYSDVEASVFPNQGRSTQYDIWGVSLPDKGILIRPKTTYPPPYLQDNGLRWTEIHSIFHDEESKSGKEQIPHAWDVIHFKRAQP